MNSQEFSRHSAGVKPFWDDSEYNLNAALSAIKGESKHLYATALDCEVDLLSSAADCLFEHTTERTTATRHDLTCVFDAAKRLLECFGELASNSLQLLKALQDQVRLHWEFTDKRKEALGPDWCMRLDEGGVTALTSDYSDLNLQDEGSYIKKDDNKADGSHECDKNECDSEGSGDEGSSALISDTSRIASEIDSLLLPVKAAHIQALGRLAGLISDLESLILRVTSSEETDRLHGLIEGIQGALSADCDPEDTSDVYRGEESIKLVRDLLGRAEVLLQRLQTALSTALSKRNCLRDLGSQRLQLLSDELRAKVDRLETLSVSRPSNILGLTDSSTVTYALLFTSLMDQDDTRCSLLGLIRQSQNDRIFKFICSSWYDRAWAGDRGLDSIGDMWGARYLGRYLDFTALELSHAGFTVDELKNAYFYARELLAAGFSVSTLVSAGFTPGDLQTGGASAKDLWAVGCETIDLKNAGFKASEMREAFSTATDLLGVGCAPSEVIAAGYSGSELREAGLSALDLKRAGYTHIDLKAAGYSASDLKTAGFTFEDVMKCEYYATELSEAGYSADVLKGAGLSVGDLHRCYTTAALRAAGYTARDLKAGYYSLADAHLGGYSVSELKEAGYTAKAFKAQGFDLLDMREGGFTVCALREAFYSPSQLKMVYSVNELLLGGFLSKDLAADNFYDE